MVQTKESKKKEKKEFNLKITLKKKISFKKIFKKGQKWPQDACCILAQKPEEWSCLDTAGKD